MTLSLAKLHCYFSLTSLFLTPFQILKIDKQIDENNLYETYISIKKLFDMRIFRIQSLSRWVSDNSNSKSIIYTNCLSYIL